MIRTLAALLALAPLPACAQQAPQPAPTESAAKTQARAPGDADPALWVVKDADTTIYLFGTIHLLKPGLTWFDEAVKQAFDTSDTLVTEIVGPDPAAMQALVARVGAAPAGAPPLSQQIPADKRPAYDAALKTLGVPAAAFDRLKPWLVAVTVSMAPLKTLGYDGANGPETVLGAAAKAQKKKEIGLETAEQQFGYFDSLSGAAQIGFLTSTIDELPKMGGMIERMVTDWSEGDPDGLAAEMNDSLKDEPEVAEKILFARNRNWAGWIAERMKQPGTVFVAVGAGHLAGPHSVQEELATKGLKAERVAY
jgi:uncharacterized protein YbaP (TraB family)